MRFLLPTTHVTKMKGAEEADSKHACTRHMPPHPSRVVSTDGPSYVARNLALVAAHFPEKGRWHFEILSPTHQVAFYRVTQQVWDLG